MYNFKEVPAGEYTYFERVETDIFTNSNQTIEIKYRFLKTAIDTYINEPQLNKYYPKSESLLISNYDISLNYFFQSKEFANFKLLFEECLKQIIKKYKGFPSALHTTKLIIIQFRDEGTLSVFHEPEIFETIKIYYNISRLWYSDKTNRVDITHELYHVISAFHEDQDIQSKKLKAWENKLYKSVLENRNEVNKWIEIMQKELNYENNPLKHMDLDLFYNNNRKIYWNILLDSALNIIAIELEDEEYIKNELNYNSSLKYNEETFYALKQITENIKNNLNLNKKKKEFLISLMILLQFIKCYNCMPINVIPYALINNYPHKKNSLFNLFENENTQKIAQSHIFKFENQVKLYFEPEAVNSFFLFWEQYKKIIIDMDIRKDSTTQDITRKIHNIESLESAKEGYKLLNRVFRDLFLKVKENEKKLNL